MMLKGVKLEESAAHSADLRGVYTPYDTPETGHSDIPQSNEIRNHIYSAVRFKHHRSCAKSPHHLNDGCFLVETLL